MTYKTGLMLCASALFISTQPVLAQHDFPHDLPHHHEIPTPPPAPPPAAPPPTAVPTPNQFNLAPPPSLANLQDQIKDVNHQANVIKEKIYHLENTKRWNSYDNYARVVGSLEEAQKHLEVYRNKINDAERDREEALAWLADMSAKASAKGGYYINIRLVEQQVAARLAYAAKTIAFSEQQVEYWAAEAAVRTSKKEEIEKGLSEQRAALAEVEAKLEDMYKQSDKIKQDAAAARLAEAKRLEEELAKKSKPDIVSAGELGANDFFGGIETGMSAETTNITPDKTLQELREDSVREAFSELNTLNFQLGFLEKADIAGQVTQTIVGFVPGATVADVALSTARGFTEALGEEIAKGTSWDDALKIASVNAGMKGTVSFVGNKLTAGADRLANRVAVLSKVGFSKLTTKQIAEAGSKGISFVVIKSTQTGTQELVGEFAGKPALKKVAEWMKDDKNSGKSTGGSKSSSSGGYGTSYATQPFVAY